MTKSNRYLEPESLQLYYNVVTEMAELNDLVTSFSITRLSLQYGYKKSDSLFRELNGLKSVKELKLYLCNKDIPDFSLFQYPPSLEKLTFEKFDCGYVKGLL
jgi:hypothetical protein